MPVPPAVSAPPRPSSDDLAAQDGAVAADRDARAVGGGVLGDVGQRLGDDVVRRRLDVLGQAARRRPSMSTGTGSRSASASSARSRPCSPRIAGCRPRAISRSSAQARCRARATRPRAGRPWRRGARSSRARASAQLERDRDEALLRAVVQVALEPAPLLVAGLDEPRARRDEVGARLRARDGERGQLAERAEAVLAVGAAAGPRWRSRPRPRARPRRRSARPRSSGSRRGRSRRRSRR